MHQSITFSWQDRLEEASSEAEVVAVARDFIATFTPAEMALLPPECRPGKFFEANDLTSYAFALLRHDCSDEREVAELVHKLAHFFSNASTRLSQIMARSNENEYVHVNENEDGDETRQSA
jgi:hypothetical protein